MKKLLLILFLLSSPAFAIDRPIPCTGNSCKLLFETTSSGGAKVTVGKMDANGFALTNSVGAVGAGSNLNFDSVRNFDRLNTAANGAAIVFDANTSATSSAASFFAQPPGGSPGGTTGTIGVGSFTGQGAWTFGASGGTSNHMVIGNLNVKSNVPGNIGNNLGIFTATSAASQSCDTTCSTEPSGMNSVSGTCIKQWTNGGVPEATNIAGTGKICLCVAIN